jgi:hypothetical protein
MQPTNKRFYSPPFSEMATVSVRRLAWCLGVPMTATVDHIIQFLPSVVDPSKVCLSCQDNTRCKCCIFGSLGNKQNPAAALAAGL